MKIIHENSESGTSKRYWKRTRDAAKLGGSSSSSSSYPTSTTSLVRISPAQLELERKISAAKLQKQRELKRKRDEENRRKSGGDGELCFPPDADLFASFKATLTQCRYCNWFNKYLHGNYTVMQAVGRDDDEKVEVRKHPIGDLDWCRHCGRVAHESDLNKDQEKVCSSGPGDVHLGQITIPFTIVSHDPRNFNEFKSNWEKEKWNYDKEEMDNDTFLHRLGFRPKVGNILASVPITTKSNIPKNGRVANEIYWFHSKAETLEPNEKRKYVSANDTDAVIIENPAHRRVLEELYLFKNSFFHLVDFNICASWSKADRNGVSQVLMNDVLVVVLDLVNICLFLIFDIYDIYDDAQNLIVNLYVDAACKGRRCGSKCVHSGDEEISLARLLAAWFDVPQFTLAELNHTSKAKRSMQRIIDGEQDTTLDHCLEHLPLEPWTMSFIPENSSLQMTHIAAHNNAVNTIQKNLTFNPSVRNAGGFCPDDISFRGTLQRFFSESLPKDIAHVRSVLDPEFGQTSPYACSNALRYSWSERKRLGLVSHHRTHFKHNSVSLERNLTLDLATSFLSFLKPDEQALLFQNTDTKSGRVDLADSFTGLLQLLENLGHPVANKNLNDGLTVELQNFQEHAVSWAIERENAPGGIQSLWWCKLPHRDGVKDLYYSPGLDMISPKPPKLVRGGFICEQMGLGKTVISLSIILQNPAPSMPPSGTLVSEKALDNTTNGWSSADYCVQQFSEDDKRGSIFSRGTLVVCNVSLVGQWVDEAKSKLKDPGLVYSYYGQHRNRDPLKLAQNSIVVTTYAVLASDMQRYEKNKSKAGSKWGSPPCERVRWWRIICDESHCLRSAQTKQTQAIKRLVAESKWCVTGTPMNTNLSDLKSQMAFIGIENLNRMFDCFQGLGKAGSKDMCFRALDRFLFVMRSIMIRHSMNQTNISTGRQLMELPDKVSFLKVLFLLMCHFDGGPPFSSRFELIYN